jgi:hypothetical protein
MVAQQDVQALGLVVSGGEMVAKMDGAAHGHRSRCAPPK